MVNFKKFSHGGVIANYPPDIIDFSANINPLGLPKSVVSVLENCHKACENYPDPFCRELVERLSKYENVPQNNILCGNGAADIIYRIAYALRPKQALTLAPTFSEYESALANVGCEIIYHTLKIENNFDVCEDILEQINELNKGDICFVCNPNNPTGALISQQLLEQMLQCAKEKGVIFIVDECFNDFLDEPEKASLKRKLEMFDNLIIIKAFTKMYAMAGIRLGYCLTSNAKLLEKMTQIGAPWSVSVVAQLCGIAALNDKEYVASTRELISEQRKFLQQQLESLGLKLFTPTANYIFFQSRNLNLVSLLLEHNILIRDCSNYKGLESGFYRVAVKSFELNLKLIEALQKVLGSECEL